MQVYRSVMSFDTTVSAGYLTNQLARIFARELARAIQPLGLAPAQFLVLARLCSGPPATQRDLAQQADVDQATMAGTLSRMERDGLIERRPNPNDGRSQLIAPSERARSLYLSAAAHATEVNDRALAVLSPDERDAFLTLLRRVIAGFGTGTPGGQP